MEEEITALEALGIAIREHMDMQKVYKNLADVAENDLIKDRIMNLYHEEMKHCMLLEKKYKEMFPDVNLDLPKSRLPDDFVEGKKNARKNIHDILQFAIKINKDSREFYLDLAESTSDLSGRRMFRFLADMKFSHQMMLTAELEVLEKYPTYFEQSFSWDAETRSKSGKIKHHT
jgi:rubrerythrin